MTWGSFSRGARSLLSWALVLVLLHPAPGAAQIVLDGTTGPPQQILPGPNSTFTIGANLGTLSNPGKPSNLFHSFQTFNLAKGERALFTVGSVPLPPGTQINNVISRVTGGASTIDGTIQSTIPNANFYLLNPSGVLFKENARINVPASFHVSTANSLAFSEGLPFPAEKVTPVPGTLSSAAPSSFGFLGSTPPASITIQGNTAAQGSTAGSILQVEASTAPLARTLSIVGGDITITGPAQALNPTILGRGGLVQVVSVKSAGDAILSAPGQMPDVNVNNFSELGTITLSNGAVIDAGGRLAAQLQPSGTVLIRGGHLELDNSSIFSRTTGGVIGTPPTGAARAVDIRLTGALVLKNAATIAAETALRGLGGGIVAQVGSLKLSSGSQIARNSSSTTTSPAARVPSSGIAIVAHDSITIEGAPNTAVPTRVITNTGFAETLGGVTITGGASLTLTDGATITSQSTSNQQASAGDITLSVGSLTATGGGNIFSQASGTSTAAAAGRITVTAAGDVSLSGHNTTQASGILSRSNVTAVSGDITVNAASLGVTDGAAIQSGSLEAGAGGNVKVDLKDSTGPIVVASGGSITSVARGADVKEVTITAPKSSLTIDNGLIAASTKEIGKAGDVTVDVATLSMTGGGKIKTSSDGTTGITGTAGNVKITAHESAIIADPASGIFSTAEQFGKPGTIDVTTPALGLSNGAQISVTTNNRLGTGLPGDITLNVGTLSLGGNARIDSGTTGASRGGNVNVVAGASVDLSGSTIASNTTLTGAGGNITIRTPQLTLTDHATISATSTGTNAATAGSVALMLGESLRLQDSAITTASTRADGGNISITTTGSQFYLLNGKITTSVQSGVGEGGNITVGAPGHPVEFVILNGSEIRADAFGGPGGNINIFAGTFLTSGSILSASSALGVPGTIGIQAQVTDVSGSISQLPESVVQAATLLRAACATRLAGGESSSLVVSGREGVPAEPGDALPSPLLADAPADAPLSLDEPGRDDLSNRIALWVPAPRCLR